jgi:hypothetical protein|tara:strand:- start:365 stop:574 length:210 start_codon:yes stop_codon:yes gene_type:complete
MGATYLKIVSYKLILLDAEGIKLKFAIIAVKIITNNAGPPSLVPIFVLPAYTDSITIIVSIIKTYIGFE